MSSWKRWDCPSPHQLGKKNLVGTEGTAGTGGSALCPPEGRTPKLPVSPGLYLILYTTTWLRDSSTLNTWFGGNQQLKSSVARAKRG